MKIKKFLKAGLAAGIVCMAAGIVGCDNSTKEYDYVYSSYVLTKDAYILVDGTVHRGDVIVYGGGKKGFGISGYRLDCKNDDGENKMVQGYDVKAYNYMPENHTSICKECKRAENEKG